MSHQNSKVNTSELIRTKGLLDKHHEVNYDTMFQLLKDISYVFNAWKIKWCTFGGTLIGACRDKDFPFIIEDGKKVYTDFDIDLFVINANKEQLISAYKYMGELGYLVHGTSSNPTIIIKNLEWADICPMVQNDIDYFSCGGLPFHKKFFHDLDKRGRIRDFYVPMPNNTKEFLDLYYTPSWRVASREHGQFLDNKPLYERLMDRKKRGI